jgi:hypothetical protein
MIKNFSLNIFIIWNKDLFLIDLYNLSDYVIWHCNKTDKHFDITLDIPLLVNSELCNSIQRIQNTTKLSKTLPARAAECDTAGSRNAGGDGGVSKQLNPCGQNHQFGNCNNNNANFNNCPLTRQERGGMCFHKNMFWIAARHSWSSYNKYSG